jgi:hypothetical protein
MRRDDKFLSTNRITEKYLTKTITNILVTVTDPYLTHKLFLTSQKTQPVTILNTKQTINLCLSYSGVHPKLNLPCSYTKSLPSSKKPGTPPPLPHPVYPLAY